MPSRLPLARRAPRSTHTARSRSTRRSARAASFEFSASRSSTSRGQCAKGAPRRRLTAPLACSITRGRSRGHTNRSAASLRTRPAFTLVEVVVALVLLATAALDVAATSTCLARLAANARATALAARTTAHVVDSLRTIPCATLAAGSSATLAGTVRWTVASAAGTRDLRAVLTPTSPRVRQPVVEEALLPCD